MILSFFHKKTEFDFMGKRWIGFVLSIILTIVSIGLLFSKGLNLGIDFTGGILMEIHSEKKIDLANVRKSLSEGEFGEISLQNIGDIETGRDIMIRVQVSETDEQAKVVTAIKEILEKNIAEGIDYRKIDYVGPTVGKELIKSGILAVSLAFICIMLYIWFRFEWQYGVGAILALFHDSAMIIGFFVVTQLDFGLTAIAAILTIIGYSINDSVVIYDRIRENMRRFKKKSVFDLINISINDTLSRTVLTAGTTLLAALALLLFGGEVIKAFSAAMVFGVIIGTYSSVYISAPTLIYLNLRPSLENDTENMNDKK
ncbi:MAG: protein translocase subunit SecF [Rickettsiales bacterium]